MGIPTDPGPRGEAMERRAVGPWVPDRASTRPSDAGTMAPRGWSARWTREATNGGRDPALPGHHRGGPWRGGGRMTHEYVILVGGRVAPGRSEAGFRGEVATALAWAADRVLAVGRDEDVRSISRGDSTFLDLGGRIVTPLPTELTQAEALLRAAPPMPEAGQVGGRASGCWRPASSRSRASWSPGHRPTWPSGWHSRENARSASLRSCAVATSRRGTRTGGPSRPRHPARVADRPAARGPTAGRPAPGGHEAAPAGRGSWPPPR
jgi:hypothetical protein